ncbi:hypothetical protein OL229_05135 [Neisseriaceae bacterium JH1-16]|nr:hypothetical protein [Neisseriaceae bacterium JH1-16]
MKLLAGQEKKSCACDKLTDSYYCFSYKSNSGPEAGTFFCGTHAAKHFLSIIKQDELPLFNPLHASGNGGSATVSPKKTATVNTGWDPVAEQLHNAINILVVSWSTIPGEALCSIKEKLERYKSSPPFLSQIKAVNTIVSMDQGGRTIQDMLADLSKSNSLKSYSFSLLNKELLANNITSWFG